VNDARAAQLKRIDESALGSLWRLNLHNGVWTSQLKDMAC
jgi:hypothetical protein